MTVRLQRWMYGKKAVLLVIFILTIVTAFLPGFYPASAVRDGSELIGKYVPDFELFNYRREIVLLHSFKGKVVLLAFWYPGDENSEQELIALEPLYQRFKEKGLEIIAVDIHADNPNALMFLARNDLSYIFLEGIYRDATEVYKIEGTPSLFLIDRQGVVRKYYAGFDAGDEHKIAAAVSVELDKEPPGES